MARRVNLTLPVPEIEIHLDGQWQKLDQLGTGIQTTIQRGYTEAVRKFSRKTLRIIQHSVTTGAPPKGVKWQSLAPSTIKRYGPHPIYNLRGVLRRAIRLNEGKSRTYIGIPARMKPSNPKSTLTLNQVMIILGHGSRNGNIPARPLFQPAYNAAGGNPELRKQILREVRSRLIKDFGIYPSQVRSL